MPIDPVCNMAVDIRHAAAYCEYKGKVYYFCSSGCHKTFTANLLRFSGATVAEKEAAPRQQPKTETRHPLPL